MELFRASLEISIIITLLFKNRDYGTRGMTDQQKVDFSLYSDAHTDYCRVNQEDCTFLCSDVYVNLVQLFTLILAS